MGFYLRALRRHQNERAPISAAASGMWRPAAPCGGRTCWPAERVKAAAGAGLRSDVADVADVADSAASKAGLGQFPGSRSLGQPRLVASSGLYAVGIREQYTRPILIRDPDAGIAFRSYAAEDFILDRSRNSPVIVAAFTVSAKGHVDAPGLIQIRAWTIDLEGLDKPGVVGSYPCDPFPDRPVLTRARDYEDLRSALTRTWQRLKRTMFC